MALSIKTEKADRLARELAAATGETLTVAVTIALQERLDRVRPSHDEYLDRIHRLQDEISKLTVVDKRTDDEIMGYDEHGLPS